MACIAHTADRVRISLRFRTVPPLLLGGGNDREIVCKTVCRIRFVSPMIFCAWGKFLRETSTNARVIISEASSSIRRRTITGSENVDGVRGLEDAMGRRVMVRRTGCTRCETFF